MPRNARKISGKQGPPVHKQHRIAGQVFLLLSTRLVLHFYINCAWCRWQVGICQ